MKIYFGIVGLFLALALVKCGEPSEEVKKLFEECGKEIGLEAKGPPNFDDPKMKCFAACLLKKDGSMVDGKVVSEKALEFAVKHLSEGVVDAVKGDITKCTTKANEEKDECEVGGSFHKCMMDRHPH